MKLHNIVTYTLGDKFITLIENTPKSTMVSIGTHNFEPYSVETPNRIVNNSLDVLMKDYQKNGWTIHKSNSIDLNKYNGILAKLNTLKDLVYAKLDVEVFTMYYTLFHMYGDLSGDQMKECNKLYNEAKLA